MELEADEIQKGRWNINLLHQGVRYNGNLTITNKNIYYDINHKIGGTGVAMADGLLKIARSEVNSVESYSKYWIFQRFQVKLKNGESYEFDRGVMSIKAIVSLLK
jgi:hypothetical protein